MDEILTSSGECLSRIRDLLLLGRRQAMTAVNNVMVTTYWHVGREIVEEEQRGTNRADYGSRLIENLSIQLTKEFGKGFDRSNLWNMRSVYTAFPILDAVRRELSWTHYRQLLRIDDPHKRSFYEIECATGNW